MKLEVSHPEGTPHEVDLPGKAVIGRDPSCDIVLSDSRCSRRHAVIEETADGLVIRDAGSANGIYVNGRRLERSPLSPGDTVRLGDTVLEVLPDVGATVVVAPDELDLTGRPPTPRPPVGRHPSSSRARSQSARSTLRPARVAAPLPETRPPLTVTALSLLWALTVPACVAGGLIVALRSEAVVGVLAAGTGLVLGALAGVMAVGLRARAAWARHLQIAAAGIGLLVCPFTFASVTVLIYMLRADVRATFEAPGRTTGAGDAEPTFALSLLGMLAVGLALTAGAVLLL
ncbi:MAG: FHA domain-containing protein [Acidobacteria bacterium]|jgi:hypothetical protein|nr:FHA domain-containing protein [Acidobacteriota bacterium]